MLVLSRKVGERILIGEEIAVTVVRVSGGGVRIGIEAPHEMMVVREELALEQSSDELSNGSDRNSGPESSKKHSQNQANRSNGSERKVDSAVSLEVDNSSVDPNSISPNDTADPKKPR